MNDQSTKEKIIAHAHKLFAEKGYNGVSIREISQAAQVNVAAINYHFNNKENLYRHTVQASITEMATDMRNLFEENSDCTVEDFCIKIFDYFVEHSDDLKTSSKMFVINSEVHPEMIDPDDEIIGPPGGKVLYDCIQKVKPKAKHDDIIFAVRVIFTTVIHKALVFTSNCLVGRENMYKVTEDDFHALIKRVVKITINDI
tara:strand:- start:137425 stop:138024 length:600 start_codon:yes stop_codon:yes gene_type:complete